MSSPRSSNPPVVGSGQPTDAAKAHDCYRHLIFSEMVEAKPGYVAHQVHICTRCGATFWVAATNLTERPPSSAVVRESEQPIPSSEACEAARLLFWQQDGETDIAAIVRAAYAVDFPARAVAGGADPDSALPAAGPAGGPDILLRLDEIEACYFDREGLPSGMVPGSVYDDVLWLCEQLRAVVPDAPSGPTPEAT